MARKKTKTQNLKLVVITILTLVITAGVVFAICKIFKVDELLNGKKEPESSNAKIVSNPTQPTDKKTDDQSTQTQEPEKPEQIEQPEEVKQKTVQYEGEDPNKAESLSGVISYAGVVGDRLVIRVNIDQYLVSGNCELRLRGNAHDHSESTIITDSASTSTCQGFDIPLSQLRPDRYIIYIDLYSEDKTGQITGEITIEN